MLFQLKKKKRKKETIECELCEREQYALLCWRRGVVLRNLDVDKSKFLQHTWCDISKGICMFLLLQVSRWWWWWWSCCIHSKRGSVRNRVSYRFLERPFQVLPPSHNMALWPSPCPNTQHSRNSFWHDGPCTGLYSVAPKWMFVWWEGLKTLLA